MKTLIICGLVLSLAGCATVTRGTKEKVTVDVEPKDAIITTSIGHKCDTQPCEFKVKRKKSFTVTAKAPGFEEQTVSVKTRVATSGFAGAAGNVLVGGIIGIAVDGITGAPLEHTPNPVNIKLVPLNSKEANPDTEESGSEPTS